MIIVEMFYNFLGKVEGNYPRSRNEINNAVQGN